MDKKTEAEYLASRPSFDSIEAQKARASSQPKSALKSTFDNIKRKLSSNKDEYVLPSSEAEAERMTAKEKAKEQRKAEYERLGGKDRTVFGAGGYQMGN